MLTTVFMLAQDMLENRFNNDINAFIEACDADLDPVLLSLSYKVKSIDSKPCLFVMAQSRGIHDDQIQPIIDQLELGEDDDWNYHLDKATCGKPMPVVYCWLRAETSRPFYTKPALSHYFVDDVQALPHLREVATRH